MNPQINLSLTLEEVNGIIGTLGELPTASGAFPLMMKITEQAQAQINEPPKAEDQNV